MKKLAILSAVALIGVGSLASTDAEARNRRVNAGAVAAGVVGGLAAGALIGAAAASSYYPYGYYGGYYPAYYGGCGSRLTWVWTPYGYRRAWVDTCY